jgi:hypothetical protein
LETKGKLFFVSFRIFSFKNVLRTFPNVLSIFFSCRSAPWRRNGLLETKGGCFFRFFSFISLKEHSPTFFLSFFPVGMLSGDEMDSWKQRVSVSFCFFCSFLFISFKNVL